MGFAALSVAFAGPNPRLHMVSTLSRSAGVLLI